MEKYVNMLKEKGLKITQQRLEVLKYLDENRVHPTADMIYNAIKKEMPSLSRTTIYNSLVTLRENGLIRMISIDPHEARYDINTKNHIHFLCDICGRIYDIEKDNDIVFERYMDGHKIDSIDLYAHGICRNCLSKNEKREE